MTTKRDTKPKPKPAKEPKVKKETLKDLQAKGGENVRAGAAGTDTVRQTCSCAGCF